ncbi:DUF4129 domain-containing protein [Salinarchaeum laminariae]|uniref:DUF4129 domain-containing protein n=1 Tax=Salinarchaeum laminariae TaxID=869888 RepID=UPI0020BDA68A|nr:DUF4129 domain-containing protein [Salinarchaeum laminariae]
METRRVRAGVVLLLAVVALGAAGAAVDSSGGGSGSSGAGGGTSSGAGADKGSGLAPMIDQSEPLFPGDLLTMLIGIMAAGGFLVAVVALVLAITRWDWPDLFAYVQSKLQTIAFFGLGLLALYFLFELLSLSGGDDTPGGVTSQAEGASDVASETGVELTAAVGVAIVIVALVVLLLIARSAEDDDDGAASRAAPDSGEGAVTSGGSNVGGATISNQPADNEVYEAWLSLASAANANAHRDTPEEVADSAVDAGVDEAAAREITSLFESVRYGDREPTSGIEERAARARAKLSGER